MIRFSIKADMLLIILVPLLLTFVAAKLFYGSVQPQTPRADSLIQRAYGDSVTQVIRVDGLEEAINYNVAPKKYLGQMELSLALALVMSMAALFGHYYPSKALWYVIIVLGLAFTILGAKYVGIKLTAFFIPNLILAALLTLIMTKLFYAPSIIRFRMVLSSILGAVSVALYYYLLTVLTGQRASFSDLKEWFIGAVINLVFVTFGLSLADLIIVQIRLKKAKSDQRISEYDEDEI